MISGFTEKWECAPSDWIAWAPDDATLRAMDSAPDLGVRTSYIQADHLRSGVNEQSSVRRLVFASFIVRDEFIPETMEAVFTDYIRAHSSFHTAFPSDFGLDPRGRTLRPEQISLTISATSAQHPRISIKDHMLESIPSLDDWAAFSFAVTDIDSALPGTPDPHFRVVIGADHLFTDAVSQAVSFLEIVSRYRAARAGEQYAGPPVRPYPEFSAEQRALGATLTPTHPDVQQWRDVVVRAGGLPRFPLPLGLEPGEDAPGRLAVHTAFVDAERTARFAAAAKEAGGNMNSAVLAALGDVHRHLTGEDVFTMLIPHADRPAPGDKMAVGWFVTLVPAQFDVSGSFQDTVRAAKESLRLSKQLDRTPIFPVIDVLADDPMFPVEHGFASPMLSYLDITRVPGADFIRAQELSVFANSTPSQEVFMWINRDEGGLDFNAMHPDTPEAATAVETVFRMFRDRIIEVADAALPRLAVVG